MHDDTKDLKQQMIRRCMLNKIRIRFNLYAISAEQVLTPISLFAVCIQEEITEMTNYEHLIDNALPGAVAQGSDLGNYGDRRISHLPYPGYCRSDRRWNHVYRRRSMYYDDACPDITYGFLCWLLPLAGMLAGLVTGIFHTFMGIPAILAGILTQLVPVFHQPEDHGKSQSGDQC